MTQHLAKHVPVRLNEREYGDLRALVLRRDGWRCQFCGSMTNLEVHHQEFRSHSGPDHEDNLITLCNTCHASLHKPVEKLSELVGRNSGGSRYAQRASRMTICCKQNSFRTK
jgi:5-methylcytosine-specific restriction endonuclease McrA